jgi:hypothetical protein
LDGIFFEGELPDLLALDPRVQWIVIELKADTLQRDAVAQGLDYASPVPKMPYK